MAEEAVPELLAQPVTGPGAFVEERSKPLAAVRQVGAGVERAQGCPGRVQILLANVAEHLAQAPCVIVQAVHLESD